MAKRGRKSQVVYVCSKTLEEFSKYDCCLVQPIDVLPTHYTILSKSYWNEYKPKNFKLLKWDL